MSVSLYTMTFLGGLAAVIGGCWSVIQERHKKYAGLVAAIGGIIALVGAYFSARESAMAQAQINANLNIHMIKTVTGGDSFCYYMHGFPVGTTNTLMSTLIHVGQFPLYDLHIRIVDGNKMDEVRTRTPGPISRQDVRLTETLIDEPTFFKTGQGDPYHHRSFLRLPTKGDSQSYSIFFTARNGSWHQEVSLRRVGGRWKLATRVKKWGGEEPTLFENISPDFPRYENHEVMW